MVALELLIGSCQVVLTVYYRVDEVNLVSRCVLIDAVSRRN